MAKVLLVKESYQPDGEFLPNGELHGVGKNIRIGDVGNLVEGLVFTTYLNSNLAVNLEIALSTTWRCSRRRARCWPRKGAWP